ncbi:dTDP-glucose 4,6-dehydratase [Tardiphaga sp. 709]|uniref:dTDP-glucose 4,6-dehydratase n=1 Tax=Tardiphaga sp. 709 TaxID=3076039 RepID=UPI0028E8F638|nr:GDP-mannose 4,6-dehydratase [Tardiphaga sp. 709]WNV09166.1 GDP-mannose 4,6-dehydratase [Tardiphaga sp. 709]
MAGGIELQKSRKTVLVTGGAGFIGSGFVRYLYDRYPDYRIIVVDALTYAGSVDNLPPDVNAMNNDRFAFWYGNVCNAELMDTLVGQSDIIVHFAAETHVTRSIYDNLLFFQTDVIGTQTIMNAVLKHSKRIERVIHISTSEVYGTAVLPQIDEDHPLNPASPYASAKCGADRLVYSYWSTYKLPAVIVRPFNNYGPRQHLEKAIPRFITNTLTKSPLTIHGDGSAARDFVYVDDTASAIDVLMHAPVEQISGEVYNVASGIDRGMGDIAAEIIRTMGGDPGLIVNIGDRPGQVLRHTGDGSKIAKQFGWKPAVDWDTGLARTIDWFRNNVSWWEKQKWMREIPIKTSSGEIMMH